PTTQPERQHRLIHNTPRACTTGRPLLTAPGGPPTTMGATTSRPSSVSPSANDTTRSTSPGPAVSTPPQGGPPSYGSLILSVVCGNPRATFSYRSGGRSQSSRSRCCTLVRGVSKT